jgi:hypothetical protein
MHENADQRQSLLSLYRLARQSGGGVDRFLDFSCPATRCRVCGSTDGLLPRLLTLKLTNLVDRGHSLSCAPDAFTVL